MGHRGAGQLTGGVAFGVVVVVVGVVVVVLIALEVGVVSYSRAFSGSFACSSPRSSEPPEKSRMCSTLVVGWSTVSWCTCESEAADMPVAT